MKFWIGKCWTPTTILQGIDFPRLRINCILLTQTSSCSGKTQPLEFDKFKFEPDNWLCFHCSERCFYLNNPLLWSWFQFLPVLYCTQETKYLLKKNIPTLIFCYCFNVRAGPDLCLTSSIVVHIQEISMALKESVPMLNKGKMRLI